MAWYDLWLYAILLLSIQNDILIMRNRGEYVCLLACSRFINLFLSLAPAFLKGDNMNDIMFELLYTIDSILRIAFMVIVSVASVKYIIKREK